LLAYNYKTHVGLVAFSTKPTLTMGISHVVENFRRSISTIQTRGNEGRRVSRSPMPSSEEYDMSTEANKAAIRTFFAAIDRVQSMAPLDDIAASSFVAMFPSAPPMDREGTKGYGNGFFAACPGV